MSNAASSAPFLVQYVAPRPWQWRDFSLSLGSLPVLVRGAVNVDIAGGDADAWVSVEDAKRGSFVTGAGQDRIALRALSNGAGAGNLFTVSTGAGDDVVQLAGSLLRSEAAVSLGSGNDLLTVSGMRTARIDAGTGDDTIRVALDGAYAVQGGDGRDTVELALGRAAFTLLRTGDGAALLGLAGRTGPSLSLAGIERIVFADGRVEWLVNPDADPRFAHRVPFQPPTAADPGVAQDSGRAARWVGGKLPGAELMQGTAANETFSPTGADTMAGGAGDDRYYLGGQGKVVERPGEGVDTILYVGGGALVLPDHVENATLTATANRKAYGAHLEFMGGIGGTSAIGNALSNVLTGDAADNTLDGMAGHDVLIGGAGRDHFVFGRGYGRDVVRDFAPGQDHLRLLDGPTRWADALALMTDTEAGVRLDLGADSITLNGVRKAQLSARDLEFGVRYGDYRLTFGDEFDGLNLFDGRNPEGGAWRTRTLHGNGHTNASGDLQYYVEPGWKGVDSVSVADGVATLTAEYHPEWQAEMEGRSYTSGILNTAGTFAQQYGYFEARMKMTAADGLFPAFWMLATDMSWPPEIDIMEQLGRDPGTVHQMGMEVAVDTTQWHVYALEWTAERLAWLVDGKVTHVVHDHNQHKPMYIILNQAIGTWGGSPTWTAPKSGDVLGTTQIDWVRAYELAPEAGGTARSAADPAAAAPRPFATGHRPDNAPEVTFSVGRLDAAGFGSTGNNFTYLADTHGKLRFEAENLDLADLRGWMSLTTLNDRDADSFSADLENGWVGLNARLRDDDGGRFELTDMALVDVVLGGPAGSTVKVLRGQGGRIETGDGNDAVTLTDPRTWRRGDGTDFTVRTGAGDDSITGWTGADRTLRAEGGAGRDRIAGSGGADVLAGGAGDDLLTGGGGADLFVFRAGEAGRDTITDFAAGTDRLRFEGIPLSALQVTPQAGGALVSWGEGGVLLQGVASAGPANWILG